MLIELEEGVIKVAQLSYTRGDKTGVYVWKGNSFVLSGDRTGLPRELIPLSTWELEEKWDPIHTGTT